MSFKRSHFQLAVLFLCSVSSIKAMFKTLHSTKYLSKYMAKIKPDQQPCSELCAHITSQKSTHYVNGQGSHAADKADQ